jgi:MATE family multidrug resistance protein
LQIALTASLLLGFSFAGVSILFPETIFGLLTNHTEITEQMTIYLPWLLLVVGLGSMSYLLEGYFLGFAQGPTVRNATLISSLLGFAPVALAAWYFHNNHILWLAMSVFMVTKSMMLGIELPRTFKNSYTAAEHELAS